MFTVCAQIRRKRLKKKVFFFKKREKKYDHRHSLKTLPLGGLNFSSRDRGGGNRQQQRKTRKISLFFLLLLLFFCVYFCSLLLWFGPQLPWMRKLLLCRYTHTSIQSELHAYRHKRGRVQSQLRTLIFMDALRGNTNAKVLKLRELWVVGP